MVKCPSRYNGFLHIQYRLQLEASQKKMVSILYVETDSKEQFLLWIDKGKRGDHEFQSHLHGQ